MHIDKDMMKNKPDSQYLQNPVDLMKPDVDVKELILIKIHIEMLCIVKYQGYEILGCRSMFSTWWFTAPATNVRRQMIKLPMVLSVDRISHKSLGKQCSQETAHNVNFKGWPELLQYRHFSTEGDFNLKVRHVRQQKICTF